jgi:hypothetical protein
VIAGLSPASLIIIPESSSVDIQWVRPSGYSQSIVRYRVGSIPPDDGTAALLYSGADSSYTHSGLTPGTTYGYRMWGYEGGILSSSSTGIITTKGTSTAASLNTPTTPWGWFTKTDYMTQNRTFLFPIVNNLADSFHMPRDTAWATWALGLSMFFGFLVWSASRSMMAVTIGVCAGIILGAAQQLLPIYMVMLMLVFGISIIAVRERI